MKHAGVESEEGNKNLKITKTVKDKTPQQSSANREVRKGKKLVMN